VDINIYNAPHTYTGSMNIAGEATTSIILSDGTHAGAGDINSIIVGVTTASDITSLALTTMTASTTYIIQLNVKRFFNKF